MDELQFDKADYTGGTGEAPTVCFACQNALTGEFFRVNDAPFCAPCKVAAQQALGGKPGPGGFVKALAGGIAGGIAGAVVYYLVLTLSGYELGIIAIAVGFLVGKGVRWGTGGRGGALYQTLAVGLTYVAIVSTYVPVVVRSLSETEAKPPSASAPVEGVPAAAPTPAATSTSAARPPVSLAGVVVAVVLLFLLTLALPFLGGFQNLLGLVIIGIGLYEAWKINKRVPLAITGPFAVPAAAAARFPPPFSDAPGS
jgi:hypothetical protein